MKRIKVTCTWESTHLIEVEDDFESHGFLSDFPDEALEEMEPSNSELIDWDVTVVEENIEHDYED